MRGTLKVALLAAPLAAWGLSTPASAQQAPAPPSESAIIPPPPGSPSGFTGKGQIGFASSTGNSTATSGNAKLDMGDTEGSWSQQLHLEGLYAKSASVVSAERWLGTFQSNYSLNQRSYVFGQLLYTNDKFSGFTYQASATLGYGYKFLQSHTNTLALQLGAGYRSLRPETLIPNAAGEIVYRIPGRTANDAIGAVTLAYEHDFSASTKLTDKALTQFGASNTLLENDFAVSVQLSRELAVSAGYIVQDNSTPPTGVKPVETFTTLNLVFTL